MEGKLCRLGIGTDEDEQARCGQENRRRACLQQRQQLRDAQGMVAGKEQKDAQQQSGIANTGNDKGLAPRPGVARLPVPVGNQGIRTKPHGLPAEIEQ